MTDPVSLLLTPIVDNVIEIAASLIKGEVELLSGVKKQVDNLSSSLTSIKAVLKDAEERQMNDPHLRDWLGKLENAAYDAENILDTFRTEAALWKRRQHIRKISADKISYQYDAAHKIREISERLDRIAGEKDKFHLKIDFSNVRSQNYPHTGYFVDTADVFGREADKERVVNRLLSDEFNNEGEISVIPIIGMAGLGKTTLAQLLFNDKRVESHFESRMWVCVTAEFNLTRILKEMIEFHSKMKYGSDISFSLMESRLLEFLVRKRFLLVLDDVWTENYNDWEPLQKLLKQGDKGSRVLVTSRNSQVSKTMGTQPPYVLEYLPEDECWSLFKKIAFNHMNLSSGVVKQLEDIGREIVDKCKGLPLAVKAMAGLLRGDDDINKWQKILSSNIWELEVGSSITDRPNILPALKLSYNYLPSYLKPCFAYCSIFPKAYFFNKEELVKQWIAESFIQTRGQEREIKIGIKYFDELLVRSFFQHSTIENKVRYRMHDLIHDLAQSISSHYCCQVNDNKSWRSFEESRHVSLLCQDVEQSTLSVVENSKKLRTLLLPTEFLKNFGKALDMIFHKLKYLRLLDLSSTTLLKLPSSVGELKLLRYLDLSRTEIKVLPDSVCELYNLQTLKLLGCLSLTELPKDLGNLVNLQNLELDDMFWFKCLTLPPRIGKLTRLQNLHAFPIDCKSGYRIEELKDMAYIMGTLHISKLEKAVNSGEARMNEKESLHKLVLEWSNRDANPNDGSDEEKLLEDLKPHSNLKELRIINYMGISFPLWITDGQLKNLVTISLNGCNNCRILSLGQLPHLNELYIKGMLELEKWQNGSYQSLCRLNISKCPKLNELPEFLPNLRVMKIKKCSSLKSLPITAFLAFLILVDNPVLENWNEATLHFISRNDQGLQVAQSRPSFVNLLEMKVINCPKLQDLPKNFAPQKLEISGCDLFSTLVIPDHSKRLQHLALDSCRDEKLVKAIPDTSSLYSLVISAISNLSSLSEWPNLPGLKALYIKDCKDLESISLRSLSSLKLMSIQGCPKLVELADEELPRALECITIGSCSSLQSLGTSWTLKSLNSLKDFYIDDCPLLQSFPEDGLPDSLQHLVIQKCPLLTKQYRNQDEEGPEWPKISHIPDLEIDIDKAPFLPKKKATAGITKFGCACFVA